MTMTMTKLTEDVSISCQSSGPVGVSDGVMTPQNKNQAKLLHIGREPQSHLSHPTSTSIPRTPEVEESSFPTYTSQGTGCPRLQSAADVILQFEHSPPLVMLLLGIVIGGRMCK